jgi:ATP-dependent Clp protease ATP-binding subunit ClpA
VNVFDRFKDRARKALGLSRQAALRFRHDYIGSEHFLIGLVEEGFGVGGMALRALGADADRVHREVVKLVSMGTTVTVGQLPFTPGAKRVLEMSLEEAFALGHTYIGTEHLLLGLLRDDDGIAARVLRNLNVKREDVRAKVLELLGPAAQSAATADGARPPAPGPLEDTEFSLFTPSAEEAVVAAIRTAARRRTPLGAHLLMTGLLASAQGESDPGMKRALTGVDLMPLLRAAIDDAPRDGEADSGRVRSTPEALRIVAAALARAADAGREATEPMDLLVALTADPASAAAAWLAAHGVDVDRIRRG